MDSSKYIKVLILVITIIKKENNFRKNIYFYVYLYTMLTTFNFIVLSCRR